MVACVGMLRKFSLRFLGIKPTVDLKHIYRVRCILNKPQDSSNMIVSCYSYSKGVPSGLKQHAKRSVYDVRNNMFLRYHPPMQVCLFCESSDKKRLLTEEDIKKNIGVISEKFTESMSLVEDAKNSFGTVYFSEDMKDAEDKVYETLDSYNTLLKQLSESGKAEVNRTVGLKMNELKAQLDIIREMCRE